MSRLPFLDAASDLSTALLSELEIAPRALTLARAVASIAPETAVIVYMLHGEDAPCWTIEAVEGKVARKGDVVALSTPLLAEVAAMRTAVQRGASDLKREDYGHLDVRQHLAALTCVPLLSAELLLGCIEIVSMQEAPSAAAMEMVVSLAAVGASALSAARRYETERNAGLAAVRRMVQLYDIEKIFNATLEMHHLLPIICNKVQELAQATTCHLWLVEGDGLRLMHQSGVATNGIRKGHFLGAGAGTRLVHQVSEDGEARLGTEATSVIGEAASPAALSVMAAPLIHDGSLIGVLEILRVLSFTDEDLFTVTQVADSAAQALHNSSLLEAERKIEVLQTVVSISQEITSTLDHQQVLRGIVNQPQRIFSYNRGALALHDRTGLRVRAISGKERVEANSPEIAPLARLLEWVAALDLEVRVADKDGEITENRPEAREKFRHHFAQTGFRGFYAIPLADEQGRLGVLSFESTNPNFLMDLHVEVIRILAAQATVALRNATLYKDVPLIGLLEPIMQKRRRLLATSTRRRTIAIAFALALTLLLFVPVPMRVSGQAVVGPEQTQYVRAEEDGLISRVFVHEGDEVSSGAPLVQMADWTQRASLASMQARYSTAASEAARALVANDPTLAGQHQLEANYLKAELSRTTEELARMTIRASLPGTVTTPHVENLVGRKVVAGDPLLETIRTAEVIVDVAIAQRDVRLLNSGDPVRIKLESLPLRLLQGRVARIASAAQQQGEDRVFFVRVLVPNPEGVIRSGMQGFAKVGVGSRPLAVVLLRAPALWAWDKLWNWWSL